MIFCSPLSYNLGILLLLTSMNLPLLTPDTLIANKNSFLCCLYHTKEHVKVQNPGTIYMFFYCERS